MIAYLSGGMEYASNDGEAWRKEITLWLNKNLNHNVIDPVINSKKLIMENNAKDFRLWKSTNPDRFIEFIRLAISQDLDAVVNKADYLICLWDKSVLNGGGTHGEITIGYHYNKPIYLVNKLPASQLSGWIMSCATEIVDDFEYLKKTLYKKYYNANNRT